MAIYNTIFSMLSLLLVVMATQTRVQAFGVCYGMLGDNLPRPKEVIDLYKSNNFDRMRLYGPEPRALEALRGSNIELIVDVTNNLLQSLAFDPDAVIGWVQDNVIPYILDVAFRVIIVGNEVISTDKTQFVLEAMQNINATLTAHGLQEKIKVSTAIHGPALEVSFPPSNGAFADVATMEPIVQFLKTTGSLLLVNVYPYFAHKGEPWSVPIEYAFFTSSNVVVTDGSFTYQNLFDSMVDSINVALEKVDESSVKVVVSETACPSDGGFAATTSNAMAYNSNLIKHLGKGTPRRPGITVETYVFAMFNENQKQPQGTENHFGLFNPDKTPVYPIT